MRNYLQEVSLIIPYCNTTEVYVSHRCNTLNLFRVPFKKKRHRRNFLPSLRFFEMYLFLLREQRADKTY